MAKKKKGCDCGSTEFVTKPNRYDVYKLDGKLSLVESIYTNDVELLFCRECGTLFDEKTKRSQVLT